MAIYLVCLVVKKFDMYEKYFTRRLFGFLCNFIMKKFLLILLSVVFLNFADAATTGTGSTGSGSTSGGGGAPTVDVISVYDPSSRYNKCVNMFPTRDKYLDTDYVYLDYLKCKTSGAYGRYQCAEIWARAKGYSLCDDVIKDNSYGYVPKRKTYYRSGYNQSVVKKQKVVIETQEQDVEYEQEVWTQAGQCRVEKTDWLNGVSFADTSRSPFVDMTMDDVAYWPMVILYERGILSGREGDSEYTDSTYPVNRAEVAKIVVKASRMNLQKNCSSNRFADVSDQWFADYVDTLEKKGIVKGYRSGKFEPGNHVTYGEFTKILTQAFDLGSFGKGVHWAKPYINVVVDKNLIPNSLEGETNFDRDLTRGEVAEMIFRTLEMLEKNQDRYQG